MNINYLYFKNLFSYGETSVRFKEDGLYLLHGQNYFNQGSSNGVGKSSFREGITWCLFGECRYDARHKDLIIKDGTDEAIAAISFTINNGKEYTVQRSLKRGKTTKLICNTFQGQTIKETQEYICDLLGMNYSIFKNSACFEQGASDSFSKLTPKEAKEVVINLLQLGIYDKVYKYCTSKASELRVEINTVKSYQDSMEEVDEKLIEDLKQELFLQELELGNIEKDREIVESDILKLDTEIRKFEQEQEVAYKNYRNYKNNKVVPVLTRLGDLGRERAGIESLKEGSVCPVCKQPITTKHKQHALRSLDERIDKGTKIKDQVEAKLKDLEYTAETCVPSQAISDKYSKLKDELTMAIIAKQDVVTNEIHRLKGRLEEVDNRKKEVHKKAKSTDDLEAQLLDYETLSTAFGRDGIPSFIIENTSPEIEEIANTILSELSDGRFKISIDTQKELKKGGMGNTLDIMISDGFHTKPYQGYSGGEKFLIDFSLRIALSVILSNRHNAQVQTLIIDEGLGSLDDNNRLKFIKAVHKVFDIFSFKKCFLITHSTDVQDRFDKRILIVKDNKGSRIECGQKLERPSIKEKKKEIRIITDSKVDDEGREVEVIDKPRADELW